VKNNQRALCQKVAVACENGAPLSGIQTVDQKRRNRHETRIVGVFDATAAVARSEWAPYVAAIIKVERNVWTFQPATGLWKSSSETSFYLSNRPIEADQAAEAVRQHWSIENGFHHVRDVTLGEDASRIRTKPGIFARFRSFAYNILRFNQADTIAQTRYAAALGGFDALAAMKLCREN
jgi:predicted transposase YbfD/YdcC